MRWFGPADSVTLDEIRQTGATAVFTALHEIPYGEAWPADLIAERRAAVAAAGLAWRVVESIPVSEAIKTRTGDFARHIENYRLTLQRIGAAGIEVVVYNFMPVLDWVRTDLSHRLADGTETLVYDPKKFAAFDLFALQRPGAEADGTPAQRAAAHNYWSALGDTGRHHFIRQTLDLFPGVRLNLSLDDFRAMLERYTQIDATRLRQHLQLFLEAIVPAAEAAGVRLAIHPDDPPFPVLGLPRIVSTEAQLRAILGLVDSPANGLCYCTGSLGVRADNDLAGIARRLGPRIHAVHLRSVQREPDGVFYEANHLEGSVDMPAVVRALLEEQAARRRGQRSDWRVAFRPDHGHAMLDDFRRPPPACPGYPLIGRLRGLAELRGLQVGLSAALDARGVDTAPPKPD
ncbi:MAG: mannonate dehydratase [Verrucomicrobia bacterium]|nr:mannonate dehydratase [Verrucomicrobiota bacterium]